MGFLLFLFFYFNKVEQGMNSGTLCNLSCVYSSVVLLQE